jgi:hypothetical protein
VHRVRTTLHSKLPSLIIIATRHDHMVKTNERVVYSKQMEIVRVGGVVASLPLLSELIAALGMVVHVVFWNHV